MVENVSLDSCFSIDGVANFISKLSDLVPSSHIDGRGMEEESVDILFSEPRDFGLGFPEVYLIFKHAIIFIEKLTL